MGSDCLYNIDHVKLFGGELEASVQLKQNFHITASYVYQEYDVEEGGFEQDWTYYLPALLPKHKIKLLGRYMLWEDGWLQLSSRYVGKRDTQKGQELDEYITVDLGFEQKFPFQGIDYTLNVFINNLTGTDYQEQAGYTMPEHVWGMQLGAKF